MATKTPSRPSRQRRAPARVARKKIQPKARQRAKTTVRMASTPQHSRAKSRTPAGRASLQSPPPEQVVAVVRKKLNRLSERWKNLLPRLKGAPSSNNAGRVRSSKRAAR